jgi:isopentenyl-diphosphate Delta-isomerase
VIRFNDNILYEFVSFEIILCRSNENDEIIGKDTRENIHKNGLLHREIGVWISNDKGEILLQRRSAGKESHPGLLAASVAGHVEVGDAYETAALKEVEEETGLKIEKKDLIFLEKKHKDVFDPKTGIKNNHFTSVYIYRFNGSADKLRVEAGEATSLEFWPVEKLLNLKEEEKKDFIPSIGNGSYSEIFKEIQGLARK